MGMGIIIKGFYEAAAGEADGATLVPENVLGWVDIKGREVGEAGLGWRLEEGSP